MSTTTALKNLRDSKEYDGLASTIRSLSDSREIYFAVSPGNYGDALINVGSRQFFEQYSINVREIKRKDVEASIASAPDDFKSAVLIVGGGGGWSKNFSSTKHFVDKVALYFAHVVVLPTTYELAPPVHSNVICFARDRTKSLSVNPDSIFCHDMAFFLSLSVEVPQETLWRLYAFRNDHEGNGYHRYFKANADISRMASGTTDNVVPFFQMVSGFKVIVTDRLHVAIAASMLEKRVFLVGGNYPKNRDLFASSLRENYSRTAFSGFEELLERLFPGRSANDTKKALTSSSLAPEKAGNVTARGRAVPTEAPSGLQTSWKIISTNPIVLPNHSSLFREPPRSYGTLAKGYLTRFDGHTLACDVFNTDCGLMFIGPPLLNLKSYVAGMGMLIDGTENSLSSSWEDLNRISRFRCEDALLVETLDLDFGPERFKVRPSTSYEPIFADENVVITLSKDNHLQNVRDWLTNMVQNHGVTAAIVYDNGSSSYSHVDLLNAMRSVEGLRKGFVVDWPYKYGNTGGGSNGKAWDSDFGQYMCWEHARWRFLSRANAVVVSDVDELPISNSGLSLIEHVEKTSGGVFSYPVQDSPAVPRDGLSAERVRLHSDYLHLDLVRGPYSRKVVYQPLRIPQNAQVGNHAVIGVKAEYSEDVISRHVSGVHMSWRSRQWGYSHTEREAAPAKESLDKKALVVYRELFPERFQRDS